VFYLLTDGEKMSNFEVVKVFARQSLDELVALGGSGDWPASLKRAQQARYLVVVRNRYGVGAAKDVEHGTAFLVAKIDRLDVLPDERIFFRLSKFKRIQVADAWDGSRFPVRYMTLADALALYGPFDDESWADFPTTKETSRVRAVEEPLLTAGLTIPQAKAGLARTLGVPESCIEISIRS
jgi:hypothetical protein